MSANLKNTTQRPALVALFLGMTGLSSQAITLFVDFGGTNSSGNWNGISDAIGGSIADAIDSSGASTGISMTITERFNGTNTNGTSDAAAPYPSFATGDSFYGNADLIFGGQVITSASISIAGLNTASTYSFTFYASRTGVSDDRSTLYTLTGGNSGSGELNASNNIGSTVSINGITPDGTGAINLVVSEGSTNNNGNGFFYLGAVEINSSSVPEPGSAALLVAALGVIGLRRRR